MNRDIVAKFWLGIGLIALLSIMLGCKKKDEKSGLVRPGPGIFFVATNGNDEWSGQLPQPSPDFKDGPFATIQKAQLAVRAFKSVQSNTNIQPIVYIRGGRYYLMAPIEFKPEDSGIYGKPVKYVAYPGETPVISGGKKITGWKQVNEGGRLLWMTDLPDVKDGKWYFRQLWVNGERRIRSRHPNKGYLAIESVPDATNGVQWTQGQSRFRFKSGDIKDWKNVKYAEVRAMTRWVESHLPVMAISLENRMLMFRKKSVFKLDPGDLYYIENILENLDTPGEWYLDGDSGKLYYMPLAGEDINKCEVIAPVIAQLVLMNGKPEEGKLIENIVFDGISFEHTEWYFPGGFDRGDQKVEIWPPPNAEVGGFAQAAVGVPGAIRGTGVRNCVFENCQFAHLGTYGIELGRGCKNNKISYCVITDLGAGGIKIGETSIRNKPEEIAENNEVSDCHIYNGGLMFHSAIGIWIGQSPSNRLIHNHIHDFYYTGISIGWTWGYGKALATNNLVEFNHVHHIGVRSDGDGPILSDMGGIYTLGLHTGTKIVNNLWHDTAGLRYGGWGIYFDEGTTGILAESNLVYRTTHGGFHQHYGKDNTVRNNIFAYAKYHQIQRSRAEEHLSFRFEKNIVLWKEGKLLDGNYSGTNYIFRSNIYWNETTTNIMFDKYTFADWQKVQKQDLDSLIADPMFVDPAKDDYRLKQGSPAPKIGFSPLNLSNVGVRPKQTRKI